MIRDFILALGIGFLLDLILGDPEWFYHPVRLIGKFISFTEAQLRKGGHLRAKALFLTFSTVALTGLVTALILAIASRIGRFPYLICMSLLDWMGLAARSLASEAIGVANALTQSLPEGRKRVARIVGRDTGALSYEEVICATVETVAENTTDGVISPMFYAAIGGPVLLWIFKAASTLDSMVGYMDDYYRDIGWSSARLDDILNFIPARLTALLMCISAIFGMDPLHAFVIVFRDHRNHTSPNCAWSEAAAAGAMHIQLGGTHTYFGKVVQKPTIGDADRLPALSDIPNAIRLLYLTSFEMLALLGLLYWRLSLL